VKPEHYLLLLLVCAEIYHLTIQTLQDCQHCGADGFSTKPFTALKLNAEIMQLRKSGRIKTPPTTTRATSTTTTDTIATDTTATDTAAILPAVAASSSMHAHSSNTGNCGSSSVAQLHEAPVPHQEVQSAHDEHVATDTATAATDDYKPQLLSQSDHYC
jgi:hypothetical protein